MNQAFYGIELIMDMSGCDITKFNRESLKEYAEELCDEIDMELALEPFFWDEENGGATDDPHLKGISMLQFIETSNITIHTLTLLKTAFINVFSCKTFDINIVEEFTKNFFSAKYVKSQTVERAYVKNNRDNDS